MTKLLTNPRGDIRRKRKHFELLRDIRTVQSCLRKENMKRITLALTLAAAALGGVATAEAFSTGNPSDFATVTLFDEDPAKFGKVLATAEMSNSPVAKRIVDADDDDIIVRYVTIEIDGEVYTTKTFAGGSSKNSIYLDINDVDHEDAMTLGELLEEVAAEPDTLEQLERTSADVSVETAQRN